MQTSRPFPRALVACHVVLAVLMSAWRAIESTPLTSSVSGGRFAESTLGRALALVSILAGVAVLLAIVIQTFRARRDWRALVLFAALGAALVMPGRIDVFDLVYVALVAIAATYAWTRRVDHAGAW
jgi:hypothetical protein